MDSFDENSVLIDSYLVNNDIDSYDLYAEHPIVDDNENDDCDIKFE